MNNSEKVGSSWSARNHRCLLKPHDLADTVIAVTVERRRGWPVRHPSPKEIVRSMECDHGFLALLGNDGDLDLAVLDVKDSIGGISLAEDCFIVSIFRFSPSPVCAG